MTSKRIMIIGAGPNQLPAIKLAKDKGYKVYVTDFDPNAVGFAMADDHALISTRDAEATAKAALEFSKSNPIHGVMTMASESAITVATVAEALEIPGVSVDGAIKATNKIKRQISFKEAGIPNARHAKAADFEEALQVTRELGWPVVLKPSDSAGSRGVQLVKDENQLKEAIEEVNRITRDHHFLIEEFLEGSEHSIEGIVINGEVHWTAFSDRNYDKKYLYFPYFMEDGDTLPTALDDTMLEKVKKVSTQAVHSLGIQFGPVKGDILVDKEGPKVIEMAARLSGDYFCYETAPLHNGINLLDLVMKQAMDEEIAASELTPKFNRGVALRYVWPQPGEITSVKGVEEVRAMDDVRFFKWEPNWNGKIKKGTIIEKPKSMGERVGAVLVSGTDREAAIALANKAINHIEITTS